MRFGKGSFFLVDKSSQQHLFIFTCYALTLTRCAMDAGEDFEQIFGVTRDVEKYERPWRSEEEKRTAFEVYGRTGKWWGAVELEESDEDIDENMDGDSEEDSDEDM